jgi:capsular exopolysaccharide synthesis family protein
VAQTGVVDELQQYATEAPLGPADRLGQFAPENRPRVETWQAPPADRVRSSQQPQVGRHPTAPATREFEAKVVGENPGSVAAAQYANLATVLHEAQLDRGLRSLLVTSSVPQEGKTLTVVNLATTLAASYAKRVLIIDADLRRPSVHRVLGIHADSGLSDVLMRTGVQLPLVHLSNLVSVLPAGRPVRNPLVRLTESRIEPLVAECTSKFDWVIVDTPPVGTGADAQLLARFVQGVIFVIRAGAAPYGVVERAISELGRECIIGTVLNGVDEHTVPAASPYGRFASAY